MFNRWSITCAVMLIFSSMMMAQNRTLLPTFTRPNQMKLGRAVTIGGSGGRRINNVPITTGAPIVAPIQQQQETWWERLISWIPGMGKKQQQPFGLMPIQ